MKPRLSLEPLLCFCCLTTPAWAQSEARVTEKDFLEDVPIVLSVSRLPQRLDETPGAVTIIDRQMIRMSGARDVADLLRLVPGFRVSNAFESNTPQGSYHSSLRDYSNHIQIMVDGRSVYSTYLEGSTGPGLQTVALEDIERIEVYRGSNSASYGARAFLGTINIVTRDPVDTQGVLVQTSGGDNGIQDNLVRLGWGQEARRFRLTADSRSDYGLQGASGPTRVQRVNFRGDVQASSRDSVELRLGQSVIDAGVGFAGSGNEGNAPRTRSLDTSYLQLDWRRNLGPDEDISFQISRTQELVRDNFPYVLAPGLTIDFGGRASNDNVSAQHTVRVSPALRWVWGGEWRRETIVSRPLYDTDAAFVTEFARLFGNVEWRLHPRLLLNAGAMLEHSDQLGDYVSPRLMFNWQAAEGHTLRAGWTQAFRPPGTYEKYANVRYYYGGVLAESVDVARGGARAERVETSELGYLAEMPALGMSLDVRVFEERVRDILNRRSYSLPGSGGDNIAYDFINDEDFRISGYEAQLKWRPWRDAQLHYVHALIDSTESMGNGVIRPYRNQTLMLMQHLPYGWNFSVLYSEADASHFPGADQEAPAFRRTDLRVARAFRLGERRAEVSFVLQNLGGAYQDFIPSQRFVQQAYLMLRLEN